MDKYITDFISSRNHFIETLSKFPIEKREDVLFGKWSLKQVIAHFAAWDKFFGEVLVGFRNNVCPNHWGNINRFNELNVEKREKLDFNNIYNEFILNGNDLIKEYELIAEEKKKDRIWKRKSFTPIKILQIATIHYKKGQLKQIQKYINNYMVL